MINESIETHIYIEYVTKYYNECYQVNVTLK